jgi:hypothetical protein
MKIQNSIIKTTFILAAVLFLRTNSFSQSYVKLYDYVSIEEFNHILDTCKSNEVFFSIQFAKLSFKGKAGKYEPFGKPDKSIEFFFVQHNHFIEFENLSVLSKISITESDTTKRKESDRFIGADGYSFSNCTFTDELNLFPNSKSIDISNCKFKKSLVGDLFLVNLNVKNSEFESFQSGFRGGEAYFDSCVFSQNFCYYPFRTVYIHHPSWDNQVNPTGSLFLSHSTIQGLSKDLDSLVLGLNLNQIKGIFRQIKIEDCQLLAPIKFIGDCQEVLTISSYGKPMFDFSELNFPANPYRIQIPISKLNSDPIVNYSSPNNWIFNELKFSELTSEVEINVIIASYRKLLDVYKENGDQASFNKLYRYSKRAKNSILLLQKEKDINTWFEFYFNKFLDWYCDYGTNPVKALIYSFYLVLIFAGLFILFPSEPDNLQRHFFIEKIGKYLSYFSSDSHLADLKRKEYEQELAELEDFRLNLEDTIKKAPSIIPWISKPYYRISMMYFNIHLWLLEKVDFARLSWNRMSKNQRVKASLIMTVYMFGFIFWGIVVRVMNGLALSMNAFITLGYGEITAKGIARYLAVVEGCMGWFLLSIFSVSLIAQMMQ